jgi:hypothetical protein
LDILLASWPTPPRPVGHHHPNSFAHTFVRVFPRLDPPCKPATWVRTTVRTRPLKLRADFPPAPPPRLISGLLALTRSAHRRPIYQSVGGVFFGGVVRPPRVDTRAHVPNHLHSAAPPPPPHPRPPHAPGPLATRTQYIASYHSSERRVWRVFWWCGWCDLRNSRAFRIRALRHIPPISRMLDAVGNGSPLLG